MVVIIHLTRPTIKGAALQIIDLFVEGVIKEVFFFGGLAKD